MRLIPALDLLIGPDGLLRRHAAALAVAACAGICASAATVALLARINAALHASEGPVAELAAGFVALGLVVLAGRAASAALTNRVGQRVIQDLRLLLARRILAAPLDALERYRTHRLMAVLTRDVDMVSGLCLSLPMSAVSAAVVIGCLGWMCWLSWPLALPLFATLALGTAAQSQAQARALARFEAAREAEDGLHQAWQKLADAAKELRLSRGRRRQLFEGRIAHHAQGIAQAQVRAGDLFALAFEFSAALYFLLIALVFALARWWQLPAEAASGFVLALLYMKGSLDQALGFLPYFARTRVPLARVAELRDSFANPEPGDLAGHAARAPALQRSIALQGVAYGFGTADGAAPFTLGPLDLELRRGEMLFIAGENGAGKTTLIKLLMGLYSPQQGRLLLDGVDVDDSGRDSYRQLFSPVLSDFHLFEELPDTGEPDAERDARAQAALERLGLAHKTTVVDGRLGSTDLSTGQRKRLAMLHAWVERRPVMVFDEWAADQDPVFRRRFYREFLPALREQGHTLVVISHDERYFDVADRVLQLRDGRLVGDRQSPTAFS